MGEGTRLETARFDPLCNHASVNDMRMDGEKEGTCQTFIRRDTNFVQEGEDQQ